MWKGAFCALAAVGTQNYAATVFSDHAADLNLYFLPGFLVDDRRVFGDAGMAVFAGMGLVFNDHIRILRSAQGGARMSGLSAWLPARFFSQAEILLEYIFGWGHMTVTRILIDLYTQTRILLFELLFVFQQLRDIGNNRLRARLQQRPDVSRDQHDPVSF
jgi:hypothetical protein